MFRRIGFIFAALALFTMAGGHWAAFQTVAWAGMLHDYAQRSGSIATAVEQTFDGLHPCELCRKIASAKVNDQKGKPVSSAEQDPLKSKATVADDILQLRRSPVVHPVAMCTSSAGLADRADQPPTPPPRRGLFLA